MSYDLQNNFVYDAFTINRKQIDVYECKIVFDNETNELGGGGSSNNNNVDVTSVLADRAKRNVYAIHIPLVYFLNCTCCLINDLHLEKTCNSITGHVLQRSREITKSGLVDKFADKLSKIDWKNDDVVLANEQLHSLFQPQNYFSSEKCHCNDAIATTVPSKLFVRPSMQQQQQQTSCFDKIQPVFNIIDLLMNEKEFCSDFTSLVYPNTDIYSRTVLTAEWFFKKKMLHFNSEKFNWNKKFKI